jgi:uncharacterized protein DUF4382
MTRKTLHFLFVPAMMTVLLAGCSSNLTSSNLTPTAGTVPVSISMTDDPPAGVQVLFFQVSLTAATLTPQTGSPVSLLSGSTPVQIDVTQLQALSAFLSTADIAPGTYTGLSLTFASPQLVIYNQSDTAIASTCAVGSVCMLTPTFDNNTTSLSFTSAPFPVSVSATSPLGFLVDFHLDTVVQSDLSVNLAATNGVSISTPPPSRTMGFVSGTVGTVNSTNDTFTLQTAWGRIFTVDTGSSTTYGSFPTSACATAGFSCVAQGQVVQVGVSSVASGGVITASSVTYLQEATAQSAEGTIIRLTPSTTSGAPPIGFDMIMHTSWGNNSNFPWGGKASVTLGSSTTYAIDSNGFTLPTGAAYTFSGASNLAVGQTVTVTVEPGTLSNNGGGPGSNGWGPPRGVSFTASVVALQPSQVTGWITNVDSSTTSFTLGVGLGLLFAPWPMASPNAVSFNVVTASGTTYTGFSTDSFSGLATNDFVSVNGWLFSPTTSGGTPNIVAQSVVLRSNMWF